MRGEDFLIILVCVHIAISLLSVSVGFSDFRLCRKDHRTNFASWKCDLHGHFLRWNLKKKRSPTMKLLCQLEPICRGMICCICEILYKNFLFCFDTAIKHDSHSQSLFLMDWNLKIVFSTNTGPFDLLHGINIKVFFAN
jgi:hypothetical protein